ncbi:MAG: ABC transporter permease [Deltaproteobacteria bacterium]|nr:ABC transporter permease [Deltaproteobacteria bacterium]
MKISAIKPVALLLAREFGITALLLLGVSFVVFIILYLSPGDPFSLLLKEQMADDGARQSLQKAAEASTAWYGQYFSWLAGMLSGNFGTSLRTGLPVLGEVVRVGINTLYLTVGSMFITLIIAVPIALFSARRGVNVLSWSFTIFAYVISALPVFWLGYIAIYVFTRKLGLFPIAFGSSGTEKFGWLYFILPMFVLGIGNGTVSEIVRYLREEMSRVFSEDYIRTARAKGASVWRHAFKEGILIPVSSIIASKVPFILGGAVVVEQVFNWPGMGRMAWQAAQDRDYPLIMGITIIAAVIVRFGSLMQKVVYIMVNPRASKGH